MSRAGAQRRPAGRVRTSRRRPYRRRLAAPVSDRPRPESDEAAERRSRLEQGRRRLEAFEASNRYESELKGTTLAMIGYMIEEWCGDEQAADFDRWWPIVGQYARVLFSGDLNGRGARKRLNRLLDRNQRQPTRLCERWLVGYGGKGNSGKRRR